MASKASAIRVSQCIIVFLQYSAGSDSRSAWQERAERILRDGLKQLGHEKLEHVCGEERYLLAKLICEKRRVRVRWLLVHCCLDCGLPEEYHPDPYDLL